MSEHPSHQHPHIAFPALVEDPVTGLLLPLGARDERRADLPLTRGRLDPVTGLIVAHHGDPSGYDQVGMFLAEEMISDVRSSLERVQSELSEFPFENAMVLLGRWAAVAKEIANDRGAQMRFAGSIFPRSAILRQVGSAFAEHDSMVFLSEQQLLILQRLVIDVASDMEADGLSALGVGVMGRAAIAAGSLIDDAVSQIADDDSTTEQQIAHLIRNGAYNTKPPPMNELVRAHEIFEVILPRLASGGHPEAQPLEQWMYETYQIGLGDQFLLGFSLAAMVQAFADGFAAGEEVLIGRDKVDDLFRKLGWDKEKSRYAEALISARRDEYKAAFDELGTDLESLVWETRPFMKWPFLRLKNGNFVLTTPRALQSWMTEGIYYRLLTAAQSQGEAVSHRFTAFFGAGMEQYALDLTRSVFLGDRPVGGGRIYGEQPYGSNLDQKTSDVVIDLGLDLVVVEVTGSRLSAAMLVRGEEQQLERELARLVLGKVAQLSSCIDALKSGAAQIPYENPDVDLGRVERIWPVLVTGNITQIEPLSMLIAQRTHGALSQAKVMPLTVLDMNDYEFLMGLVEAGHDLPTMLRGKTTPPFDKWSRSRFSPQS